VVHNNSNSCPIAGVQVLLYSQQGNLIAQTITDLSGFYSFNNMPDGNYTVTATSNLPEVGITLEDAILVMQYINGLTTLTPLQIKAADVNFDGVVNTQDMLLIINKYIFPYIPFAKPWVFETINVTINGGNNKDGDDDRIRGTSTGDVGGIASPPYTKEDLPQIALKTNETIVASVGSTITVPIKFTNYVNVDGLGLVLNYPNKYLEVQSVSSNMPCVFYSVIDDKIRIGWRDTIMNSLTLSPDETLATITFTLKPNYDKNKTIEFSIDDESEVVYDVKNLLTQPVLELPKIVITNNVCSFSNLWPNPMVNKGNANIITTEEGKISLNIFDNQGKKVLEIYDGSLPKGEHYFTFNVDNLSKGNYLMYIDFKGENNCSSDVRKISITK